MSAARNPTSWDDYEGGASPGESVTESMLEREQALVDDDNDDAENGNQGGFSRRRRYGPKKSIIKYSRLTRAGPLLPTSWLLSPTLAASTAFDPLPGVGSEPRDSMKLFPVDRVLFLRPTKTQTISSTVAAMFRDRRNRNPVFCANTWKHRLLRPTANPAQPLSRPQEQ